MQRYASYDPANIIMIVVIACGAIILLGVVKTIWQAHKQAERRRQVMSSKPILAQDFLASWRVGKRGSRLGYASLDRPGCYVILTNPLIRENGDAEYEAVYVGQSAHVCSRVRQHFTGHGNGDVYADVRAGKRVEVRIVPCNERAMNDVERDLIAAFRATSSYNHTRGGSRRR